MLLPLLFVGVLMGALDLAIIGPALPAIKAQFDMNDRQLSVLFNAYVLCQLIGTPLIAKLGDRIGARLAYIFSIGLFAGGSMLLVWASDPAMLYFGRAFQGFGGGGIFPVAATVIGNSLPAKERGPALGILGTVFGLAFIVGPVMGGLLLPYGWHWLFLVNLPIAVVLIAGAAWLLPTRRKEVSKPVDAGGILTLALLLTALVLALNNLDARALAQSVWSWPAGPALLAVVILAPLFWRIERRAADPIIRPGLLQSRPVVTACLIGAGIGAIQAAGGFYPALAVSAIGVSQSTASWMLLPGVAVATIASPISGRLINVVSIWLVVTVCLSLMACSVLMFGLVPMSVASFIMASVIGSAGMGGVLGAPLRLLVLNASEPGERGAAQGLLSNLTSIGRLGGAAFVGAVAASAGGGPGGYQTAFVGVSVIAAIMVALGASLRFHAPAALAAEDAPEATGTVAGARVN